MSMENRFTLRGTRLKAKRLPVPVGLRQKKQKRKHPILRLLLCLCLIFFCLFFLINRRLSDKICTLATVEASNRVSSIVARAITKQLTDSPLLYSDLITLQYKSDGSVAAMNTNMPKLLQARGLLTEAVLAELRNSAFQRVSLPVGMLSGIELLSGVGPTLTLDLLVAERLEAYMESTFESTGINQTIHRISLTLDITVTIIHPAGEDSVTIHRSGCVAETVIVGDVPDAYTNINRLTDTITETDIDDLYDFGATLS